MSTSNSGYTRSSADNFGKKKSGLIFTKRGNITNDKAVVYADATTVDKYTDIYDGTEVVCGGYVRLFTGIGCGVLIEDTKGGEIGQFELDARIWAQLNTGETPAFDALIYWDDTNKEFTTTSSSNTLAGFVCRVAGLSAGYQVVSATAQGTLPAGTWVHVQLVPFSA